MILPWSSHVYNLEADARPHSAVLVYFHASANLSLLSQRIDDVAVRLSLRLNSGGWDNKLSRKYSSGAKPTLCEVRGVRL